MKPCNNRSYATADICIMMADEKKDRKICLSPSDNAAIPEAISNPVIEIIEYEENTVVSKIIIKRNTGNITVMSFDEGQGLQESFSPFESFSKVIEGRAGMVIN